MDDVAGDIYKALPPVRREPVQVDLLVRPGN